MISFPSKEVNMEAAKPADASLASWSTPPAPTHLGGSSHCCCPGTLSLDGPPPRTELSFLRLGSGAGRACPSFSHPLQDGLAEHPAQATHLSGVALLCLPFLLSWNETALEKKKYLLFSPSTSPAP